MAAQHQGISLHAFMVDAIRAAGIAAEKRAGFIAGAQAARIDALASGQGYHAEDVHAYLRARAQGLPADKPEVITWRS